MMPRREFFATLGSAPESLPNTEVLAKEALSIAIYPELKRTRRDEVTAAIATLVRS